MLVPLVAQQVQRSDRADDQRGRQIGGQHHVNQAIGKRGIEDDGPPVERDELTGGIRPEARRRLHPAIDRQNPEGGHEGAKGNHRRRQKMKSVPDALSAKEHDAQKSCLEEKCGKDLITHQRAENGSDFVGPDAPVGAKLVAHHNARNNAHAECNGEDLLPVIEQVEIDRTTRQQRQAIQDK